MSAANEASRLHAGLSVADSVEILAMYVGQMRVIRGGGNWGIEIDNDPISDMAGGYIGATFDDALQSLLRQKFGDDLIAAADKMMALEANAYPGLDALFETDNAELTGARRASELNAGLCHTETKER